MIGSRLLFSGYGIGFKGKPLHAGFLGQDALLVHDEAHLEPAFQELIKRIEDEQKRCGEFRLLRVMELTATSRGDGDVFELTKAEKEAPAEIPDPPTQPIHHVWRRTHAKKSLTFYKIGDEKKELVPKVVELALVHKDAKEMPAVLVFVRTVESVNDVVGRLKTAKVPDSNILTLTGTMRGYERDRMTTENGVFARFAKASPAAKQPGTVYLICTSAGEVGVDMSADHMVCDLSTYDSMAQRFGRVNRYGNGDARIDVVYPATFDTKDKPLEAARERTFKLLEKLRLRADGLPDASPASLGELLERAIREGSGGGSNVDRTKALREYVLAAFAPPPTILPVTDILFDAWALTTIRDKLPGRPKVEPYLHGLPTDWQPPQTQVAWRDEVFELHAKPWIEWGKAAFEKYATKLLEEYPLKPQEVLKEATSRVFDRLKKLKVSPELPVWVQSEDGAITFHSLGEIIAEDKESLNYVTLILPPGIGGLNEQGMLDEKATATVRDVSDAVFTDRERTTRLRVRVWNGDEEFDEKTKDMRRMLTIDFPGPENNDDAIGKVWQWYERGNQGDTSAKLPVEWHVHVGNVVDRTREIVANLSLSDEVRRAVIVAAECHDHGKRRKLFQRVLGNFRFPTVVLAKSGGKSGGKVTETYRHEFGSLWEVVQHPEWSQLSDEQRDLVLHLIAAHHGRARPHFPAEEAFDPERLQAEAEAMAVSVPRRFARLQRKYGRWGLAYLESLLRAADWAASAKPSEYLKEAQS
jgi:CRISPR-associated endonuclease/helicase Cas3